MERDANYVAVGAFVVVVVAMAAVFVLWYSNAHERREYQRYEVYFSGSVSGLNEGSTVRYLGVTVGRVARIRLDQRDAKRVQVLVDLDASTPVTHATLARLSMQGVTGLLFIDLSQALPDTRGVSPEAPSERYPVIRSVPSDLDLFLSGLPDLVAQATYVTTRLNRALSDENLDAFTVTLRNLKAATRSLPATAEQTAQLVTELRELAAEAHADAVTFGRLEASAGPELTAALARLNTVADHLAQASARVDGLLARHEQDIDRFASQGLGDLQALLREGRAAAAEVRALARSLREDPSRLLYPSQSPALEIPR